MRLVFALLLVGMLFLGFGCPQEEAPSGETGEETTPGEETPGEEPSGEGGEGEPGEEPAGEEEITHCGDGTLVGECSVMKPKICDIYGNLVDDPKTCGCPENSVQRGSECIYTCEDETLIGQCSSTQPFYCNSQAVLEEKASVCKCPPGYDVDGEGCRNACDDGTPKYACSTETPPYYCSGDYELVMNPLVCGCHPWEFLLEGKCFDPSAQNYTAGETIRVSEGLSLKVEKVYWENCDDGTYARVQLTVANSGKEGIVLEEENFKLFVGTRRAYINRPSGCGVGHIFDWGTLRGGETESGQVWFKVLGGSGDLHAEYLHYYTPSVLKEFYIDLEEED